MLEIVPNWEKHMHTTVWEERVDRISGYLLRAIFVAAAFMVLKNMDTIIVVVTTPSF